MKAQFARKDNVRMLQQQQKKQIAQVPSPHILSVLVVPLVGYNLVKQAIVTST